MIECDAHAAAQTKQKTIREMLLQFPEDHFDLMTPGGFVTLTPVSYTHLTLPTTERV